MRTTATTLPRYIGPPRATAVKTLSKRGFLNHCRYLVESTDWDEKFLDQEKWINRICLAIVAGNNDIKIPHSTPSHFMQSR